MSDQPPLSDLPRENRSAKVGIVSICSAHPRVLEAAIREACERRGPLLIEATCNQVNQEGGYTGMTPRDFREAVVRLAEGRGLDKARLILGGDHLGPNPWRRLSAEEAMSRAEAMVDAYVRAGFSKIHLDTSMGCAGEPTAVPDDITADRAARLARVCEDAARDAGLTPPNYIIGTEVPVPGGATEALGELQPTRPEAVSDTIEIHRKAFAARGLEAAFDRAIGLVVQPGVEFASESIHRYDRAAARDLVATGADLPGMVFEAHSTDYQPKELLRALVEDGFAILKVGPALTFALREALYGLDAIRAELEDVSDAERLPAVMERMMLASPDNWEPYYEGDPRSLKLQRHFSYSDRIRYYWNRPEAEGAVERLFAAFGDRTIPEPLISQYLGGLGRTRKGNSTAPELVEASIRRVIANYGWAVGTKC